MANRCNDWQGMIKLANEDLKKYGAMILHHEDEEDGTFSVEILFGLDFANFDVTKYKECEEFAENYYEDERAALINDAWAHARAKAKAMLKPKKAKKAKAKKSTRKEYQALVAFGSTPTNHAAYNDWAELADYYNNQDGQALGIRKFKTAAERNAYIIGMNDALGWEDVYVLDSKEERSLSKHLDLSKLIAPPEF